MQHPNTPLRWGSALSYDAEAECYDYIYNPQKPEPIAFEINEHGNTFVALCRRTGTSDDKEIFERALRRQEDYDYSQGRLTLHTSYLNTLEPGTYVILSAVFAKGQSVVFTVYASADNPAADFSVLDFNRLSADFPEKCCKLELLNRAYVDPGTGPEGAGVLRIAYDFRRLPDCAEPYYELRQNTLLPIPKILGISMWVYGDNSGHIISIRMIDRSRSVFFPLNDFCVDWQGWRKLVYRLPEDAAMPGALKEVLRIKKVNRGCLKGEIKIADVRAICDRSLLQNDSPGIPWIEYLREEPPFSFDFTGISRGSETKFRLKGEALPTLTPPIRLYCDCAAAPTEEITNPPTHLLFDKNGELRTDAFTADSFPAKTCFALHAEDASGRKTAVRLLTVTERCSSLSATPTQIVRTVTGDLSTTAAFSCLTDTDTLSLPITLDRLDGEECFGIDISEKTVLGRESEEETRCFDMNVYIEHEYRAHRIDLKGLQPNTAYRLTIGDAKPFTFKTFPTDPKQFDAILLADAHNGHNRPYHTRYRNVIRAGQRRVKWPYFAMEMGDMVNTASDGIDYEFTIGMSQKEFETIPFAPTPGNHERDIQRWFDNYQTHWHLPDCGVPLYRNLMYSFDIGSYHFTGVCADGIAMPQTVTDWLAADLAATDKKWKIVFMHCSPYGSKGIQTFNRDVIAPILDRYGVDVCFSGHEHIYVRATVCEGKKVPIGRGVTYFTMGTSGIKCYEGCRKPWQDFVYGDKETERFVGTVPDVTTAVAHFAEDKLIVDVQMASGRVVDYVVIEKNGKEREAYAD